jgi:hypothetical protein
MHSRRIFTSLALAAMLAFTPALFAQQSGHLVSPAQLQQQMQSASAARQHNIDTLTRFLSTPMATHAMKSHGFDPVQVKNAIPNLSNAELASLSARAEHAQQQFAAGNISDTDLLIIILVLVLVVVIAVVR